MGTGPGALNMPYSSPMGVPGVPGCFRRSQRASGTAAEKDFHFMVPSRPKGSSTCITGRWNAPKMVLFFRGFEGQMPKVKTMLPCAREHDFQGCGASDFVSFRAPHSRHFLGPFFCTPIWFFRCEVENMGGQREPQTSHKSCKKGSRSHLLLFWDPSGGHGTPRIIPEWTLAQFCMNSGTYLTESRVF